MLPSLRELTQAQKHASNESDYKRHKIDDGFLPILSPTSPINIRSHVHEHIERAQAKEHGAYVIAQSGSSPRSKPKRKFKDVEEQEGINEEDVIVYAKDGGPNRKKKTKRRRKKRPRDFQKETQSPRPSARVDKLFDSIRELSSVSHVTRHTSQSKTPRDYYSNDEADSKIVENPDFALSVFGDESARVDPQDFGLRQLDAGVRRMLQVNSRNFVLTSAEDTKMNPKDPFSEILFSPPKIITSHDYKSFTSWHQITSVLDTEKKAASTKIQTCWRAFFAKKGLRSRIFVALRWEWLYRTKISQRIIERQRLAEENLMRAEEDRSRQLLEIQQQNEIELSIQNGSIKLDVTAVTGNDSEGINEIEQPNNLLKGHDAPEALNEPKPKKPKKGKTSSLNTALFLATSNLRRKQQQDTENIIMAVRHFQIQTMRKYGFQPWKYWVSRVILPARKRLRAVASLALISHASLRTMRAMQLVTSTKLQWRYALEQAAKHRKRLVTIFLTCVPCEVDNSSSQMRLKKDVDKFWAKRTARRLFQQWKIILDISGENRCVATNHARMHTSPTYGTSINRIFLHFHKYNTIDDTKTSSGSNGQLKFESRNGFNVSPTLPSEKYNFGRLPSALWKWSLNVKAQQHECVQLEKASQFCRKRGLLRAMCILHSSIGARQLEDHKEKTALGMHTRTLKARCFRIWSDQRRQTQTNMLRAVNQHRSTLGKHVVRTWKQYIYDLPTDAVVRSRVTMMVNEVCSMASARAADAFERKWIAKRTLAGLRNYRDRFRKSRLNDRIAKFHTLRLAFRYWSTKLIEMTYAEEFAALTIQCLGRQYLARTTVKKLEKRRLIGEASRLDRLNDARALLSVYAIRIQALARGIKGREKANDGRARQERRNMKRRGAVIERRLALIRDKEDNMARHRQREKLKARQIAAGHLQRWYRGCNLRINQLEELRILAKTEQTRRKMKAIMIQKCIRKYLAYYSKHSTHITAWWRGIKGRMAARTQRMFNRHNNKRHKIDKFLFSRMQLLFRTYRTITTVSDALVGLMPHLINPQAAVDARKRRKIAAFYAQQDYIFKMKTGNFFEKKVYRLRFKYVSPLLGMRRRLIEKWNMTAFPLEYADLPPVSIASDVYFAREQLRAVADAESMIVERLRAITDAYQVLAAVMIQCAFRRKAASERYRCRRAKLFLLHQPSKLISKLKFYGVHNRYGQMNIIKSLQSMGLVKVKWQTLQELCTRGGSRNQTPLMTMPSNSEKFVLTPKLGSGIPISLGVERLYNEMKTDQQISEDEHKLIRRGVLVAGAAQFSNFRTLGRRGGMETLAIPADTLLFSTGTFSGFLSDDPDSVAAFKGVWKMSLPHGFGSLEADSNNSRGIRTAIGKFVNGKMDGAFRVTYVDGSRYSGGMTDDARWDQMGKLVAPEGALSMAEVVVDALRHFSMDLSLGAMGTSDSDGNNRRGTKNGDKDKNVAKNPLLGKTRLQIRGDRVAKENALAEKKRQEFEAAAAARAEKNKNMRTAEYYINKGKTDRRKTVASNAAAVGDDGGTDDLVTVNEGPSIRMWGNGRFRLDLSVYWYEARNKTWLIEAKAERTRQHQKREDVYHGEFLNGEFHGKGVLILESQRLHYVGSFHNGHFDGFGKLKSLDGAVCYSGYWVNGQRHGLGEQRYANGSVYRGHWAVGAPHGQGELSVDTTEALVTRSNIRRTSVELRPFSDTGTAAQNAKDRQSLFEGRKSVAKTRNGVQLERARFVGMFHHGHKYGRGTVWFENNDRRPGVWTAGRLDFWICQRISMRDTDEFVNRFLNGVIDLRGDYATMVMNRWRANNELDPALRVPGGVNADDERVTEVFRMITHEAEIQMYEEARGRIEALVKAKRATLAHVVARSRNAKKAMEDAFEQVKQHRESMEDHRVVLGEAQRELELWRWLVAEKVSLANGTLNEIFSTAFKKLSRISLHHLYSVTVYSSPPTCIGLPLTLLFRILRDHWPFKEPQLRLLTSERIESDDDEGISARENEETKVENNVGSMQKKSESEKLSGDENNEGGKTKEEKKKQEISASIDVKKEEEHKKNVKIVNNSNGDGGDDSKNRSKTDTGNTLLAQNEDPEWFKVVNLIHDKPMKFLGLIARVDWTRCRCATDLRVRVGVLLRDLAVTVVKLQKKKKVDSVVPTADKQDPNPELIPTKEPVKIKPAIQELVSDTQIRQERQQAIDFSGCSLPQMQTLAAVWAWLLGWHAATEVNDRISGLRERSDAAKLEFQKQRKVMTDMKETLKLYDTTAEILELEHVELEMRIEDLTAERDEYEERMNSGLVLTTDEEAIESKLQMATEKKPEGALGMRDINDTLKKVRKEEERLKLIKTRRKKDMRRVRVGILSLQTSIDKMDKQRAPPMRRAQFALNELQEDDWMGLWELGFMPPQYVSAVGVVLCHLLKQKAQNWQVVRNLVVRKEFDEFAEKHERIRLNVDFVKSVQAIEISNLTFQDTLRVTAARERLGDKFDPEYILKQVELRRTKLTPKHIRGLTTIAVLCKWMLAFEKHFDVERTLGPQLKTLKKVQAEYDAYANEHDAAVKSLAECREQEIVALGLIETEEKKREQARNRNEKRKTEVLKRATIMREARKAA